VAEIALLLGCYLVVYALFWLPASVLVRRQFGGGSLHESSLDLLTLVLVLAVSYSVFWVYLVHARAGALLSAILLTGAILLIVLRRKVDTRPLGRQVSLPVRAAFLFGMLYLACLSLHGGLENLPTDYVPGSHIPLPGCYFWLSSAAGDEMIPLKFAQALASGEPLRGALLHFPGDWQFSDRPPLQSAVILLFWPLMKFGHSGILGQAIGTMLQVQWVVGFAALVAALGWGRRRTAFVILLLGLSGFAYYNSTYAWPKLLGASLTFAAAAALVGAWRGRRALTNLEIALAATAASLALLSHGSLAFSLIPVALLAFGARQFVNLRTVGLTLLLTATFYGPWAAYQRFVDPPGDRCARWMLAAKTEVDAQPLGKCVRDAYSQITLREWLVGRARGLLYLVSYPDLDRNVARWVRGKLDPHRRMTHPFVPVGFCKTTELAFNARTLATLLRFDQNDRVFRVLGVLNIAWPLLAWRLVRRRRSGSPGLVLLFAATAMGLVLWWLLIFEPLALTVRNSSYATILGLMAVAASVIYDLPGRWRWPVAACHLSLTGVLWVAFVPTDFARSSHHLSQHMLVLPSVLALAALAGIFHYCLRRPAGYPRFVPRPMPVAPAAGIGARPRVRALSAAAMVAFLLLVGLAVYSKSPIRLLDRHSGRITPEGVVLRILPPGADNPAMLFDGIADRPDNYAALSFQHPLVLEFPRALPLQQIRLHLFDDDGRFYRLQVEGQYDGQWCMLLDRSQQAARGRVEISLAGKLVTALRVTGLYNSDQETNPNNKLLHLKELELICGPAGCRHP